MGNLEILIPAGYHQSKISSTLNPKILHHSLGHPSLIITSSKEALLLILFRPHFSLFFCREYNTFRVSSDGELNGVGLLIAQDPNSGRLLVLAPIKGSPADRAGIKPGDEVLSVDGTSTAGWNGEEAARVLRGEQGSSVMVEVARHRYPATMTASDDITIDMDTSTTTTTAAAAIDRKGHVGTEFVPGVVAPRSLDRADSVEYKRFRLRREKVEISPIFATAVHYDDHTIGYVRLVNFSQHAATEMEKAIKQLKRDGAESFILDLRNNPGGLVRSSLEIASLWLNGDTRPTIFSIEDRGSAMEESSSATSDSGGSTTAPSAVQRNALSTNPSTMLDDVDPDRMASRVQRIVLNGGRAATDLPLVVLVNGQSASASEILAGALHDNYRAEVIGDRTFGKGKIQSVFELGDGSALFVTVAKYRTPSGADIDSIGVMPDRSCSLNGEATHKLALSVPGIPVGRGADELVMAELETDDCVLTAEALLDEKADGALLADGRGRV